MKAYGRTKVGCPRDSKPWSWMKVLGQDTFVGFKTIPSRGLTYPTWGKGKSSSKCHSLGICSLEGSHVLGQLVYTPGNWRLEPTAITHEKKGKWSEPNLQDYVQNVNLQVGTMQSDCNHGGFNLSKVVSFTTRLPQIKPVAYFNLITIHGVHLWYVYLHFVRYSKFPSAPIPSTSGLGVVFSYLNTEPHSVEH